ncbi:K+ channel [Piscirickettsia salmonis]|uniref:Voltage-gated potassium channel protein n=1 Tax=Piscirickettsia salmonis TaxID=1238 RepID=A0A1L6TG24_PISSA|nr:potassium channel family protein [Piscirickettsia salmonis]AKP74727.1 ion channel family protein [Piscirickettsia salmonis LF-89 = ATCC VR-1361]ALB21348.1 Voltage-gated potassium channel protein [Piscirickettsia salmonis]ALY01587.1 ion channel family protein [Piscirickettsia salmonis]AMA41099.1 ion channel family protein [Piscirickettsia salmonis]AOS36289.1 ion channel family protein [Piscirickettsia salmonis]
MRFFLKDRSILLTLVGYGGLAKEESVVAVRWYQYFFRVRMFFLILLMSQWYLELRHTLNLQQEFIANLTIWSFFVIETVTLLVLVRHKVVYLRRQWVNILVICAGLFLLIFTDYSDTAWLQFLRLLLVAWLLIPWLKVCYLSLTDNRLGTTLVAAFIIMIFAGILISAVDTAFPTPLEGIWFAWVTVSTVGYGDYVPSTLVGRVFGAGLILMGMALFSVITANFSSMFVSKGMRQDFDMVREESENILQGIHAETEEIKLVLERLHSIKVEEDDILANVRELRGRIKHIEKALDKKQRFGRRVWRR